MPWQQLYSSARYIRRHLRRHGEEQAKKSNKMASFSGASANDRFIVADTKNERRKKSLSEGSRIIKAVEKCPLESGLLLREKMTEKLV